jgi:ferric-dicitrate binding protein FerR (iron transport regulator)
MLASLPVEGLPSLHAREHAAGCHDCDRVTREVLERERNVLTAFGELDSSIPAAETASSALVRSRRRRRRIALYYAMGIGFVMVAIVIFMM